MESHDYKKPWYELYTNVGCSGIIYVNDIYVNKYFGKKTKDGFLGGQVPINQVLLQSGKYKVRGVMFPRYGENTLKGSKMAIDFDLSDVDFETYGRGRWKETNHEFRTSIESPDGEYVPNPDPNAEYGNMYVSPLDKLTTYVLEAEIEVELPFVIDGWQNSVDLSKQDKNILFKDVLAYYRQIHALLKEHNAVKFLELSQEKMKLQETAFYLNEEKKEGLRQDVLSLFNENLEVEPLVESDLKLELMGYGKLVRLIKLDGSEPLQFKSPNIKEQSNVELEVKLHMRTIEKGFSII